MVDGLEPLIEAILFAAGEPVSNDRLRQLLAEESILVSEAEIRAIIDSIAQHYYERGIHLVEVASGYRFQARPLFAVWLQKLNARKNNRYSKAFLETLALVLYRQPITRGEIEEIRGVAVSSQIIKSLLELDWIKVVGHRDAPGKPALYGTTSKFLDDFNIRSLSELPPLQEVKNLNQLPLEIYQPEPELVAA